MTVLIHCPKKREAGYSNGYFKDLQTAECCLDCDQAIKEKTSHGVSITCKRKGFLFFGTEDFVVE